MKRLTTEEAIERDELAARMAEKYMAGFKPSSEEVDRAIHLGLDPEAVREAVDVCYESGEDEA